MENNDELSLVIAPPSISNNKSEIKEQEWKTEHETILVEWADKAMCYRWLHARSHQAYSKTNTWFTIPVIIMSTLTGTANFAQDKIDEQYRPYAQMGIGAVNIFAGILTTIAQFLKISELNEAHRVSSISWDKFYRNIKVELSKSRDERMHVTHMLKMGKEEFDRLMETSPSIDDKIVDQFNRIFPTSKPIKKPDSNDTIKPDIIRPEICDELVSTAEVVYSKIELNDTNTLSPAEIVRQKNKLAEASYEKDIILWSSKFEEKHNRKPLNSELYDNLQGSMNKEMLIKIIKKITNTNDDKKKVSDPMDLV
jgi:hypothetical protein